MELLSVTPLKHLQFLLVWFWIRFRFRFRFRFRIPDSGFRIPDSEFDDFHTPKLFICSCISPSSESVLKLWSISRTCLAAASYDTALLVSNTLIKCGHYSFVLQYQDWEPLSFQSGLVIWVQLQVYINGTLNVVTRPLCLKRRNFINYPKVTATRK